MARRISHVIGFDDAPFPRNHRGDVLLVGAVYAGPRLEGVLSDKVRRDGINATRTIVRLVSTSHYREHLQAVLLQGIAFAGFNVMDIQAAFDALQLPVIVVSRRQPDMDAVRVALLDHVPGGQRKWRLIQKAGPVEPAAGVYVQRAGISLRDTEMLIERFALNGKLPEPLRTAHLIAGGIAQEPRSAASARNITTAIPAM